MKLFFFKNVEPLGISSYCDSERVDLEWFSVISNVYTGLRGELQLNSETCCKMVQGKLTTMERASGPARELWVRSSKLNWSTHKRGNRFVQYRSVVYVALWCIQVNDMNALLFFLVVSQTVLYITNWVSSRCTITNSFQWIWSPSSPELDWSILVGTRHFCQDN